MGHTQSFCLKKYQKWYFLKVEEIKKWINFYICNLITFNFITVLKTWPVQPLHMASKNLSVTLGVVQHDLGGGAHQKKAKLPKFDLSGLRPMLPLFWFTITAKNFPVLPGILACVTAGQAGHEAAALLAPATPCSHHQRRWTQVAPLLPQHFRLVWHLQTTRHERLSNNIWSDIA